MTADFIPKRPHKKSRGGCSTCKTRKIKCDEGQPKCSFCSKRSFACTYPSRPSRSDPDNSVTPSSSQISGSSPRQTTSLDDQFLEISWDLIRTPTPPVMSSSGALSATDLRLMHHWSTMTSTQMTVGRPACNVLQFAVPQLAFENEFLMNTILAIASSHLGYLNPDQGANLSRNQIFRAKALSDYRQVLTRLQPNTRTYEAALVMSIMLVVLYSQDKALDEDDLIITYWVILYRGLQTVFSLDPNVKMAKLSVMGLFTRELTELKTPPVIPTLLVNLMQEIHPLDPDFKMLKPYCETLDALGVLYASLRQDGISPALFIRVVSWGSFLSQEFANCAIEKRPRALILLAHFLLFVKLVKGLWWLDGLAVRDLRNIGRILGPKWLPYLDVPLRASRMINDDEIVTLMLS